jgi:hypothetical protein
LLAEEIWVRKHHLFPCRPLWQGAVVDDYFGVSTEPASKPNVAAASLRCLGDAEAAQSLGSDEKIVRGEEIFQILGAEVTSGKKARDIGLVSVSAPAAKRIPMSYLSFKLAAMPIISRALASDENEILTHPTRLAEEFVLAGTCGHRNQRHISAVHPKV